MLEPVGERRVRHADAVLPRKVCRLVQRLVERGHLVTVLRVVGRRRREQALDGATSGELPLGRRGRVGRRVELAVVETSASTRPVCERPPLLGQLHSVRRPECIADQRVQILSL